MEKKEGRKERNREGKSRGNEGGKERNNSSFTLWLTFQIPATTRERKD